MPPDSNHIFRSYSKAGALLHSLVPRAEVFCFYDADGACAWSSDNVDDYEIDNFVAELPTGVLRSIRDDCSIQDDKEPLSRTLSSGRTALAFVVLTDDSEIGGLLVALFSKDASKASSFDFAILKSILDPAIAVMSETLSLSNRLAAAQSLTTAAEEEIELVYEIDEKIHGASGRHSNLAQLVGRSGRYLAINYSVLLIPSKRIRISATHSSWKNVNRKVLDRYLVEELLPKLEGQHSPVVFKIPAMEGAENAPDQGYQALLCPVLDVHGNVEGILAQLGRVSQERFRKNDRRFMSHIARKVAYVIEQSFDAMTGLMNRSGFETQLRESFISLKTESDTHQLIYFDLDNLQLVNDTFGRKAGDELIVRFARLLEEDLPKSGVLSRLTGDEFCLLLTHADSDEALAYANTVRGKTSVLRYLQGDKSLQVTMSVGIADFDRSSDIEGTALTTARMACEAAKEHGRDRIEIYDDSNRSVIRRYDDMQLVAEIQRAIDGNEFELHAQPIVSLDGAAADSRYEILLRMDDADGGRVSTAALFSAAERYRIMPQIDRWVVSSTLAALSRHRDLVLSGEIVFSINLSGQSLGDDEILLFIEQEIAESGVPTSALCFEITESAAVSNLSKAQAFIDRLRAQGCQISLDDFGAGLSSFAYLKNFSVDTLKIDGSFIRDITTNRISESMVVAITQVAKVMGLKTVAEYVETAATQKLVKRLGVDYAQGHINGKPQRLSQILAELSQTSDAASA